MGASSHAIRTSNGVRIMIDGGVSIRRIHHFNDAWRQAAACKGMNTELFFPACGEPTRTARQICKNCPVRSECKAEALEDPTLKGIWGGTSDEDRRRLR